jgi:hypothetical protein
LGAARDAGLGKCALEARDEPIEHTEVLFGVEDLRRATEMNRDEVPRRHARTLAVPPGRDVAVRTLHDDEQLALAQTQDRIIGLSDMPDDGEVITVLVEEHCIVRGHKPLLGPAHERPQGWSSMTRRSSPTSVIAKLGFCLISRSLPTTY